MAASTIFFTGFPGFLGSELLPLVLRRDPDAKAVCLVQDRFLDQAEARASEIERSLPALKGRIEIVEGDIVQPDLGLGTRFNEIAADTTSIFHLAAVYDLSVSRELGLRVNVDGTKHVCDFAKACPELERLHYVSTCYVSGRYAGIFREDDLVKDGQTFNNHYEETKHLAEMLVRERMDAGLPVTIYRPAVVAGDSQTGETQKLDGIYYIIRWVLRQLPLVAALPMLGDPTAVRFNVVPRDLVVNAIAELSGRADTVGQCFAIADPNPMTIDEIVDRIGQASHKYLLRVPLPVSLAKAAIDHVPFVGAVLGIPSDAADYFVHPTHYDTRNTETALADTDILEWDKQAWVQALVDFTARHMQMTSDAMV